MTLKLQSISFTNIFFLFSKPLQNITLINLFLKQTENSHSLIITIRIQGCRNVFYKVTWHKLLLRRLKKNTPGNILTAELKCRKIIFEKKINHLEFLSNTGPNTLKKFFLDSSSADGTSLSNCGSTLSYDRRFSLLPRISYAKKKKKSIIA